MQWIRSVLNDEARSIPEKYVRYNRIISYLFNSMRSKNFMFTAAALLLIGAGCVQTPAVTVTDDTENEQPVQTGLSCPSGMAAHESAFHVRFCYPLEDDGGNAVTVADTADGVVLSVGGDAVRKIAVVRIEGDAPQADVVLTYANDRPESAECSVLRLNAADDRSEYIIVGEINGEQTLEAVAQCNSNSETRELLDGLGDGIFFLYEGKGYMHILSGEQDPSLGAEFTDEFISSIQYK